MNAKSIIESAEMERQFSQEVAVQEVNRSWLTGWMQPGPDGLFDIPKFAGDLHLLKMLSATAKLLAKSKQEPCKSALRIDGVEERWTTRIGERLAATCNMLSPQFVERHRRHAFNPWIQVMVVAIRHWHPGHRFRLTGGRTLVSAEDHMCLSRMARFVRRVCESRAFKRRLQDERRLALQNFRSASIYLIWLFTHHSRLLILRVDLYYTGEGREEAGTEQARAAFERFLRMLRSGRIVPGVLGCMISREVGAERGVHFHVLVVMDGHKYQDADGYTRMIGERWVRDYTGPERGTFYNCYARRHEHEFNGLGLLHLSDWRKLVGLRLAMLYMTKAEYLIKLKDGGEKNFRRGLVRSVGGKLGAPRRPENGLSTVYRLLGA